MGTTWRLLLKELSAFGVVGAVCFVIDVVLFQLLYAHAGLGAVTAKSLATLVSMTVAYFAHRYWSFSHRARTGVRREYMLFAAGQRGTLLLNLGVVAFVRYPLGQDSAFVLQVANVASIARGHRDPLPLLPPLGLPRPARRRFRGGGSAEALSG